MTVNEFAQDVHKNAVAHGWYDAPITFPEVAVMIHAEISEAVEEWRSGNPVIYGTCALSPENCKFSKICDNVGHPSGADTEGNCKPEGVAVELCDAVMRIMDFLAFMGVDIEAVLTESRTLLAWAQGARSPRFHGYAVTHFRQRDKKEMYEVSFSHEQHRKARSAVSAAQSRAHRKESKSVERIRGFRRGVFF